MKNNNCDGKILKKLYCDWYYIKYESGKLLYNCIKECLGEEKEYNFLKSCGIRDDNILDVVHQTYIHYDKMFNRIGEVELRINSNLKEKSVFDPEKPGRRMRYLFDDQRQRETAIMVMLQQADQRVLNQGQS